MNRIARAMTLATVVTSVGIASATDGTLWVKNDNGNANWATAANWYYDTPAGDGGIVWSKNNMLDKLNQNVEGLELTGFDFSGRWMCITNKPIKFVAPYSWLTRDSRDMGGHHPGWEVVFKGTGDNVMNIAGNGELHTMTAAEDFANFRLLGNAIRAWNTSGDVYSKGNFQLLEATAFIEPQNAAGDDTKLTLASTEGSRFVYGPSLGLLRVNRNKGRSATLSIGTLERFAGGGVMAIMAESGLGNLGGSERVMVLSDAPANVNGICDASIVGRSADSPYPLSFLTYDDAVGFKVASAAPVAFAQATADDVALVDGNVSVSGERHIHALYVKGEPTISFAEDAVLRVGDGVHPAGVIFNPVDANRIQPALSGATGTIDFGGSLGCIYFNNPANSPTLTIEPAIAGSGGVVFSGGFNGTMNGFALNRPAGWTGATVITRARMNISKVNPFPENGDVYVMGGRDGQRSANLRMTETIAFGENQRFHFSGFGHSQDNGGAAIHTGGAYGPTFTFNGPVELCGPGGFLCDGADNKLVFNGKVTGGGWWRFNNGVFRFTKPMDFAGVSYVGGASSQLVFSGEGRPGPGEIKYLAASGTLLFEELSAAYVLTNGVSGGGIVKVVNSDVTLDGRQTFGKLVVGDGAVIRLGKNVVVGSVVCEGSGQVFSADGTPVEAVCAVDEGVEVILGRNVSFDETVTLVKKGTGVAMLARDAAVSGAVCVAEGTLRMAPLLAYEASYWLDAADDPTVVRGDDGRVSAWRSKIDGTSFTASNVGGSAASPMYTNRVNGLPALSFNWEEGTRLAPNCIFAHRTVFICMRPNRLKDHSWSSPWGALSKDYGLRFWNEPGFYYWDINKSADYHFAYGSANNGGDAYRKNGAFDIYTTEGEAQIVTLLNKREDGLDWHTCFTPGVGGHYGQPKERAFDGELCEIISFDRILEAEEIMEIENYLSGKWGLKDVCWNDGVPVVASVLPETAKVSVEIGGTLDLNGCDQSIAELTGCGEIANSSDEPAVLTVTGTCTFSGKITGNVILRKAGGGDVTLNLNVDDGGVEVADGKVAFKPYVQGPCTNGIVYWLDAAWNPSESITMDGDGLVSEVKSRGGVVEKFVSAYNKPLYVAAALGGNKPTFDFRTRRALKTDRAVSTKTIVMVLQRPTATGISNNYFWGRYNADKGFRLSGTEIDKGYSLNGGTYAFAACGDYFVLNGTKTMIEYNQSPSLASRETPYRLVVSRGAWHADSNYENVTDAIGSYENRDCDMMISEVISYDHVLSDDELRQVDKYLKEKWFSEGPILAADQVFSATSTLGVDGGEAILSGLSGVVVGALKSGSASGTVTGDLTISGFSYDAEGATDAVPLAVDGALTIAEGADFTATGLENLKRTGWTLLSAESATGAFETFAAGPRKWTFDVKATSWGLGVPGLLLFIK